MINSKEELRKIFLEKRAALSLERRRQASSELLERLLPLLADFDYVLSFSSIGSEIDMDQLNDHLESQGRLILPKVSGNNLLIDQAISCALIPALAFDSHRFRLGFGKGYYDRFLEGAKFAKWGVGFKEQLIEKLPTEPHDQRLDKIYLF